MTAATTAICIHPCKKTASNLCTAKAGGRKVEKRPGIAAWTVLLRLRETKGSRGCWICCLCNVNGFLPPSQMFSRLCSHAAAEQKAVRSEPLVWLPGLTEPAEKAPSATGFLAQPQTSAPDAVHQYWLCWGASECGSRFAVSGRGAVGAFACRWL